MFFDILVDRISIVENDFLLGLGKSDVSLIPQFL